MVVHQCLWMLLSRDEDSQSASSVSVLFLIPRTRGRYGLSVKISNIQEPENFTSRPVDLHHCVRIFHSHSAKKNSFVTVRQTKKFKCVFL